jgi:hypothetical protein
MLSLNKAVLATSLLAAQLVTFTAMAQLTPGPSHGGGSGGRPPQYNPCDVPSDPNCPSRPHRPTQPNRPERPPQRPTQPHRPDYPSQPHRPERPPQRPDYPSHPHRPDYPSRPSYPTYPSQPNYPTYPSQPSYPTYPTYPDYPSEPSQSSNWIQSIYTGYISNVYNPNPSQCSSANGERIYPIYRPEMYGQRFTLNVNINRSVYNQLIDLNQLFRLKQNYAGARIYSVKANTTPNSSARTVAELVVSREVYAYEINPGYDVMLNPCSDVYISEYNYNNEIYMSIVGSTYINSITIELVR